MVWFTMRLFIGDEVVSWLTVGDGVYLLAMDNLEVISKGDDSISFVFDWNKFRKAASEAICRFLDVGLFYSAEEFARVLAAIDRIGGNRVNKVVFER